jgi:hypothetical protein
MDVLFGLLQLGLMAVFSIIWVAVLVSMLTRSLVPGSWLRALM